MKVFRIDDQYFFLHKGIEGSITLGNIQKGNVIAQQVTDVQYNDNEEEEIELQNYFNKNFDLILTAKTII